MNREKYLDKDESQKLYRKIMQLHSDLDAAFMQEYDRSLPFNEVLVDRWERAKKLSFGTGTSIYDTALVFGSPTVGSNCWIGPFTIIDGSGGLTIGNFCTISAGVHIYTHDNVKQTLSGGRNPIEHKSVSIGNNVYIAPNSIITKGVLVGNYCVIGASALVNKSVPDNSIIFGRPGRVVGKIILEGDEINFEYFRDK